MENEENDDEHLTESELGTKAYWEDFYQTELENFVDSGDQGETWFGRRNTNMIIQWIAENVPKEAFICDVGCGNGFILSQLATRHSFLNLLGIDYSPKAIDFCRQLYQSTAPAIQFKVVDILSSSDSSSSSSFPACDVLVDKGTYDAIALMPDGDLAANRRLYRSFVLNHLTENGHLVIMSCNFTREELCRFLLLQLPSPAGDLTLVHEFATPKLSFGGKVGSQVTGLVLKRQRK